MRYCPCCKDEFEEGEEFCNDCKLPLLAGTPVLNSRICDCDELPLGEYLRILFEMEGMDSVGMVVHLTKIRDGEQLDAYIKKLLALNGASCDSVRRFS